jgi:hypothetical protein
MEEVIEVSQDLKDARGAREWRDLLVQKREAYTRVIIDVYN